jgi:Fe-S cluster assembly ATP-binding protein
MSLLSIKNLCVSIGETQIIHNLSLEIKEGEVHAIMGPNGSGKSTLVNTLMGHPKYTVTKGSITFRGEDILTMDPDERAKKGLFLAFQYPKEIKGVTLRSFLYAAYKQQLDRLGTKRLSSLQFKKYVEECMKKLYIDPSFEDRFVNHGFSGGEKKKAEVLQLTVLRPLLALLDETDSGLDIDALKIVADGINFSRNSNPKMGALLVTHYARMLKHITPDHIHVIVDGRIVESGERDLVERLENEGYEQLRK